MAYIQWNHGNEKALLKNFIHEDETELRQKQQELAEVVTKLNGLEDEK